MTETTVLLVIIAVCRYMTCPPLAAKNSCNFSLFCEIQPFAFWRFATRICSWFGAQRHVRICRR